MRPDDADPNAEPDLKMSEMPPVSNRELDMELSSELAEDRTPQEQSESIADDDTTNPLTSGSGDR
jgi:hypothetical protein